MQRTPHVRKLNVGRMVLGHSGRVYELRGRVRGVEVVGEKVIKATDRNIHGGLFLTPS